ncbi:hypothetical protein L1987_29184 [Smallanthus sonchifolius]|uniref:Uncharacterized protein n=1 Tax=Smallanthus sonchifolius TaxID=185202 RepID=A0ACB9HYN3_9ASTR|nr:hypothetical protein L1987_29184 [Smallanthus sonchifolius]
MYAIFVAIKIGLVQVVVQMNEYATEIKIPVVISLTTIVVNFFATKWKLTHFDNIEHNHWKVIIYNVVCTFTETLFFCSILIMLASEGLPRFGFPIACAVVTLVQGPDVLRFVFNWFYKKLVDAMTSMIEKLSVLILRGQLPTNDHV